MNQKVDALNKTVVDQTTMIQNFQQFSVNLGAYNANIYAALIKLGVGMSNSNLIRIPLADYNLGTGVDSDHDGLSDVAEAALGTDPNKADTNGDTYNDKESLLAGYSAISTTTNKRLPIDLNFAKANAGKISSRLRAIMKPGMSIQKTTKGISWAARKRRSRRSKRWEPWLPPLNL